MLRAMHSRLANGLKLKQVSYTFEYTVMWEPAWKHSGKLRVASNTEPCVVGLDALLDELRLNGTEYDRHRQLARERFLAIRETDRLGVTVGPTRRKKAETEFRRQRNLATAGQLARWMRDNDLEDHEFEALITEEARAQWIQDRAQFVSLSFIPQQLRLSGHYRPLVSRARAKSRLLRSMGLNNSSLRDAGLTVTELWRWHFEKVLKIAVPKKIGAYARNLGYSSVDAFRRALLKEYLFRRFKDRKMKRTQ